MGTRIATKSRRHASKGVNMGKPNHAKRSRPKPISARRRVLISRRVEELRSRRHLERWRRAY